MRSKTIFVVVGVLLSVANVASATVVQGIDIDFVTIGNPGNPGDTRVGVAMPSGCGAVAYNYSIGKYEITNSQWNIFVSAAGAPTGRLYTRNAYDESAYNTGTNVPTDRVSWYEAAQFCNYLTSGDKSQGAYLFSGDNTNPDDFLGVDRDLAVSTYGKVYVIPTENEWYKAAYFKPDGSGYSKWANGSDSIPTADNGWNFYGGVYDLSWNVGTGTVEQNGTFDMMGNVSEWNETAYYTARGRRGASYNSGGGECTGSASCGGSERPYDEFSFTGFRVASVPEPCTLSLFGLGAVMLRKRQLK